MNWNSVSGIGLDSSFIKLYPTPLNVFKTSHRLPGLFARTARKLVLSAPAENRYGACVLGARMLKIEEGVRDVFIEQKITKL